MLQDQQNQLKVMKIKVNCKKIKDMKIKLLEIIRFMNRATRYMDLEYLKQQDLLVIVFITTEL